MQVDGVEWRVDMDMRWSFDMFVSFCARATDFNCNWKAQGIDDQADNIMHHTFVHGGIKFKVQALRDINMGSCLAHSQLFGNAAATALRCRSFTFHAMLSSLSSEMTTHFLPCSSVWRLLRLAEQTLPQVIVANHLAASLTSDEKLSQWCRLQLVRVCSIDRILLQWCRSRRT